MQMQNILQNIVIVTLNITLWSGRKKLRPEDLKLADGSELPPDKLASLGSKRVMDPEALAPFAKHKRRAERDVLAVGTRFLGGYAIPVEKIGVLMPKLAAIQKAFEETKEDFLAEYDRAVDDWVAENPGWGEVIRRAVEDVVYVRRQLSFSVQSFNITPVEEHTTGLEAEVNGLADQLRHEVRQVARSTWDSSYHGKIEVGQKAVRPVRAMLEKIEGLVFLEPGLNELVDGLKTVLAALPKAGSIKGADFAALCGALHLLGNIPEAQEIAENPPVETEPEEPAGAADQLRGPQAVPVPPPVPIRQPVQPPTQWF
jgi:hypothetical protein